MGVVEKSDQFSSSDVTSVLKEVKELTHHFLKNNFQDALDKVDAEKEEHSYYHLLKSYFLTVKGMITFEEEVLENALKACHEALTFIDTKRKRKLCLLKLIWTPNYDEYTEDEVHAEVCYATVSAFVAVMTLMVEKSFVGLVKAGYRIKSSYDILKECRGILKSRTFWESEESRVTFESGVQILMGMFNLITSHFPTRILRLVQFLGFSGDRPLALQELEKVAFNDYVWSPMAAIVLLTYNTQIEYIIGLGEGNVALVTKLLDRYLISFKDSGFFLIFAGMLETIEGRPDNAIAIYEKTLSAFSEWKQLQNICYWFMTWSYAIDNDWKNAAKYAKLMSETCNWSPCTSSYQLASFLHMMNENEQDPKVKRQINDLMRMAPSLKHSVGGKTVFLEKFVTKRCQLYRENESNFVLPVLELFLLWNIFPTMKKSPARLIQVKDRINAELSMLVSKDEQSEKYVYLKFMDGVVTRYLGYPMEAIRALKEVIKSEKKVNVNSHLPAQASLELGLIHKDLGDYYEAKVWLDKARSDYSHYLNETMVHLRVHCALMSMKEQEKMGRRRSLKRRATEELDCY